MDPMIKNSFFTILIYWNDNRIHLGLTKKLIFFILFPPLLLVFENLKVQYSGKYPRNAEENMLRTRVQIGYSRVQCRVQSGKCR